eukprot:4514527-Ditylum_brightwellii.AAC.1
MLLLPFHFHKVLQYRPPVTSNMVTVSNLILSHFSSSSRGEKEKEINEDRQKKSAKQNEIETTFEFETKRHRLGHGLGPATSKNPQYMNMNILIHQGLSLTVTLVKSNIDERNSCFNKTFLQSKRKCSNG